jgi:hypothetical protein
MRIVKVGLLFAMLVGSCGLYASSPAGATASAGQNSQQFAGYTFSTPAEVRVQAQFVVPKINCGSNDGGIMATVQILTTGGFTAEVAANVFMQCNNGSPTYFAEAFDRAGQMPVSPGDSLVLRAQVNPANSVGELVASVDDLTTGTNWGTGTLSFHSAVASTAWIASEVDGLVAGTIPNFGKIQWVKASVNGSALGSINPESLQLIEHPNHPKVLVSTAALSSSGRSFKNVWVNGG